MKIINIGNIAANNYSLKTNIGYITVDTGYAGKFDRYCCEFQKHIIWRLASDNVIARGFSPEAIQ